ncbi:BspA family leucine-rich repeat surface protein [Flagellimonas sp. 2504JD1-5]
MKLKNLGFLTLLAVALVSCDVGEGTNTPKNSTNLEVDLQEDPASFITKWEIPSHNFELTIGILTELSYQFVIDWGDGTVENLSNLNENPTHTYAKPGTYLVAINGSFPAISMYNLINELESASDLESQKAFIGIIQWGAIEWETFEYAFYNTDLSEYSANDQPDLGNVTNMESMFYATNFNGDIGDWDTSNITNMDNMFSFAFLFNQDIGDWDTSNVTTMEGMFASWDSNYKTQFNQDISGWNVGNVSNFRSMFVLSKFNRNLASWDITSATSMDSMFNLSSISVENYSNTLIGWAAQNVQPNVPLGAMYNHHNCTASDAKETLEANGWTFQDLGPDQDCQ